jgi:hypothetical protein
VIWTNEILAAADPLAVWDVLVDGRRWGELNADLAWMWVDESLAPGAYLTIKPMRGRQTAYVIEDVVPQRRFAIRLQFGPAAHLRRTWTLAPEGAGTRIVETIEISGFAAGWLVQKRAEGLAAAAPQTLAKLAARAQKNTAPEGAA